MVLKKLFGSLALVCTSLFILAIASPPARAESSAPVAFVYVSHNPAGSSTNEVNAYAAAANGKLTPVSGSPFRENVTSMVTNGRYLFGSTQNGIYIAAFAIEGDGALRWTASTDVVRYNQDDCGSSGPLFFDRSGATLYDMEFDGNSCANNSYQSFSVNRSSGRLGNLGSNASGAWFYLPATFLANNRYAYTAVCLSNLYWEIAGFRRNANGLLTLIGVNSQLPTPKSGDFWCPSQTATDDTNHVAMTLQAVNQNFQPDGPAQLVTYTADASGNLSTTSTRANMPAASVGAVADLKMSPSGQLLAVGGSAGLQVFHFHGSSPITHFTGLLTNDPIDQFFWDNDSHLYAISRSAGKLFVFTVTSTSASQAPGSPYTIANPVDVIVQPK